MRRVWILAGLIQSFTANADSDGQCSADHSGSCANKTASVEGGDEFFMDTKRVLESSKWFCKGKRKNSQ